MPIGHTPTSCWSANESPQKGADEPAGYQSRAAWWKRRAPAGREPRSARETTSKISWFPGASWSSADIVDLDAAAPESAMTESTNHRRHCRIAYRSYIRHRGYLSRRSDAMQFLSIPTADHLMIFPAQKSRPCSIAGRTGSARSRRRRCSIKHSRPGSIGLPG